MKLDTHRWCAVFVFIASLFVYAKTMAVTVSFWDCGEFAACSYTMSVPHPPGSPLFLLIGRFFSLLPISSDIAVRVTWISVLASAFAILFAYLIIVRLVRHIRGPEKTAVDRIIAYGGGVIGSLTLAWSYSMWFNAVESEVYALSQFFTHLVVWLILVWHERADEPGNERWLLLIAYMIGLSTGVHLLMILAIFAIALVIYFRRRQFSLGSFVGTALASIAVFFIVYPGIVKWLPGSASKFNLWVPVIVVAAIAFVFWWAVNNRHGIIGVAAAGVLLVIVGYSSYGVIYIRSQLNPGIDENDPDTPAKFLSYLNREQYGERDIFPRVWNNDPAYKSESDFFWRYQVNKMFNRYLFWQFIGREGAPHREYQDAGVEPNYTILKAIPGSDVGVLRWLAIITCAPFVLGLIGLFYQFVKDKPGWLVVGMLFLMTGYGVIIYLNQDNPQPRERDYSYVGAFFAFALWIGLGAAAVIEWIAARLKSDSIRRATAVTVVVVLFLLSPVMLVASNWEMQDRSDNYVAWDYSYNMLMSLEPNAILFTNGDNDTFPVWYMQEVEKVRTDVRIVNLSLLNTGWYIKQLKVRDPKVPISFSDFYIDRYLDQHDAEAVIKRYWPPERQRVELNTPEGKMDWKMPASVYIPFQQGESRERNFLRVQDIMILDILRTNYDPAKTPEPKPVYFAVTVANSNMIGLQDYLTMEGLVFKINPEGGKAIDPELIRKHLFETFDGHFRGIDDPEVHFDDNVSKLLQNYRSAFLQLAYHYTRTSDSSGFTGKSFESLTERMANFDQMSNRDKALTALLMMDEKVPEAVRPISNVELSLQLGQMFWDLGSPDELSRRLDLAWQRGDLSFETRTRVAAMWAAMFDDTAKANSYLQEILGDNPDSEQLYQAGAKLFSGGSFELAAHYFKRSLEVDSNNGSAIGGLMQAYERTGQLDLARDALQDWVERFPRDRGAAKRLEQLNERLAADTGSAAEKNQ